MDHPVTRRLIATFEGRVQGVGFRWTAARAARQAGVVGWVRNELDGSVHLVAEGRAEQLEQLLHLVRAGMEGHITRERLEETPATGEFATFEIAP